MSRPISIRFPDDIAQRVSGRVATTNEATSGLVVRLVDEGIRMAEHPGIVFRNGPTGRRAGLAAGPDVWEIICVLRDYAIGGAPQAVRKTAAALAVTEPQVRTAEGYYAAFPAEIDDRIGLNADAADLAASSARVRADLRR